MKLDAEPECAKQVVYRRAKQHSEENDHRLSAISLCNRTGYDGEENHSDKVSSSRTGKFSKPTCESGEDRETYGSKKQIDEITDRGRFPSK